MNPQLACSAVRQAIRNYLPTLPESDSADLVVLATALHAISPTRTEPLWIALVGHRDAGRDALIDLLGTWSPAWPLPHGDVVPYLAGIETKEYPYCRLERARTNPPKRLLLMPSLRGYKGWDEDEPWSSIHEGTTLRYRSKVGAVVVRWEPEERLNAIGSVHSLVDWQRSAMNALGVWLPYRMVVNLPRIKARRADLEQAVALLRERNAREPFRRQQAESAVMRFLEESASRLSAVDDLELTAQQESRLQDGAELCRKIATVDFSDDDYGQRLYRASRTLVRYVAWLRGAAWPEERDLDVGLRLIASQILRTDWGILRFINQANIPPRLTASKCANRGMPAAKVLRTFDRFDRSGIADLILAPKTGEISLKIPRATFDLLRSIDPHRTLWPVIVPKRIEIVEDTAAEEPDEDPNLGLQDFMARFGV